MLSAQGRPFDTRVGRLPSGGLYSRMPCGEWRGLAFGGVLDLGGLSSDREVGASDYYIRSSDSLSTNRKSRESETRYAPLV
jgi:hypothetical protein